MGTYLTVEITDEKRKSVESLETNKGDVGAYSYAFDEEALHFRMDKRKWIKLFTRNWIVQTKRSMGNRLGGRLKIKVIIILLNA